MNAHFDTSEYRFSHDHAPRGRGSWAFDLAWGASATMQDSPHSHLAQVAQRHGAQRCELLPTERGRVMSRLWIKGTYSESKRIVRAIIRDAFASNFHAHLIVKP